MAFQDYPGSRIARPLPDSVKVIDVHTRAQDTFGVDILREVLADVDPDLFVIYNDSVVTCRFLNELLNTPKKCPIVAYCDFVYDYQSYPLIEHIANYVDSIVVYSRHWVAHLERMGVRNVTAFPHGVDAATFYPVPTHEARRRLGLPEDAFLVMNTNRNSYRKHLDVTIKAFLLFWKAVGYPEHVKLVLNMREDIDEGYDVGHVVRTACFMYGLPYQRIMAGHILKLGGLGVSGVVPESQVNDLYNACDIGLNTCGGEGFGLTNAEMACLGKPQIVTRVGGLADNFGRWDRMCVDPVTSITLAKNIDSHSGELAIVRPEDFAAKLRAYYENPDVMRRDGEMLARECAETCHWPTLLETFRAHLQSVVRPKPVPIYWINLESRPDRRERMERQMKTRQTTTRVPAIPDAQAHVSCMKSHDAALRRAYADGHDLVCVCEDDVILSKEFDARVRDVIKKLPMGWDCCQLHYVSPGLAEEASTRPQQQLCRGYLMSAACYMYTRKGLKKYLEAVGVDSLEASLDHPRARAEELVYRYVSTYCTLHPLVATDETLGSSIPENAGTGLNERNAALLDAMAYPTDWVSETLELPLELPDQLHYIESRQTAARLFPPRVCAIVPGYGAPHVDIKRQIVASNVQKIHAWAPSAHIRIMQYDDAPDAVARATVHRQPRAKVGEYLRTTCAPTDLPPHDLVLLVLDDVEMVDVDLETMARALQYCDVVSPTLTADSKCVYGYMRSAPEAQEDVRIGPACELFMYLMTAEAYRVWHSHLSMANPWCWGMDLMIGGPMGLRVGRMPRQTMRHHLAATAYGPDDQPMRDCVAYLDSHGQTYDTLAAGVHRISARIILQEDEKKEEKEPAIY
jgi:glycosyltransferase involved in cell wall biosynthesis